MYTIDPTTAPVSGLNMTGNGLNYSVDQVARMQNILMRKATYEPENVEYDKSAPERATYPSTAQNSFRSSNVGKETTAENQKRNVSGRYRGKSPGSNIELELRIDVDGLRPTRRVSGDFYQTVGGTITYVGSFIVTTPTLTVITPTHTSEQERVIIDGEGIFTFTTGSPRLWITIPRVDGFMPPASAVAQFMTTAGVPGAQYTCAFESSFFRRVEFEMDFVKSVQPFKSYKTGVLPSGGPDRTLTVAAAFAEAGIDMPDPDGTNEVPFDGAGIDSKWTNRELHTAMENHFSRYHNEPGWRVWLLAATLHENGPGLRGIMFDRDQRQGCAVFHDVIGGSTDQIVRAQLRTYVHELGHCFNLYHSHHKEYMQPPQPNRLDALSWMHYPDYYRSGGLTGAAAYWAAFPFQFDDLELIHLRHAFRNDIIMGGNPFGLGAADLDPLLFADPIEDLSGLRLSIKAAESYYFGEPIVVELKLELTDIRGKRVNTRIHPNYGYVQIAIKRSNGKIQIYQPLLQQCAEPEVEYMDVNMPAAYDSAYIGYGKKGFYFDDPGAYELRAVYHAMDGSKVFSNTLRLRVDAPINEQEREIANLFLGEDQGKLLYLLGSDGETLQKGNDAFEEMIQGKHKSHPMAIYAKLVKGMNASRPFKKIETDLKSKLVSVRPADYMLSKDLLSGACGQTIAADPTADSMAEVGLDNITLNMAMQRLAEVQKEQGDVAGAQSTCQDMVNYFSKPHIPSFVQDRISSQAAPILGVDYTSGTESKPKRSKKK
ncbi:hypothetical protein [Telluribacter humicola]|uniref:hypothetical protein n=1 Tax=Telluribacter humicola TaxID=1720261 RepID=UPI001A97C2F6|nr:hypothetical protein [Telluribacter humicola]